MYQVFCNQKYILCVSQDLLVFRGQIILFDCSGGKKQTSNSVRLKLQHLGIYLSSGLNVDESKKTKTHV